MKGQFSSYGTNFRLFLSPVHSLSLLPLPPSNVLFFKKAAFIYSDFLDCGSYFIWQILPFVKLQITHMQCKQRLEIHLPFQSKVAVKNWNVLNHRKSTHCNFHFSWFWAFITTCSSPLKRRAKRQITLIRN